MSDDQGIVIVGSDGTEHHFPTGMDPQKAAAVVRQSEAARGSSTAPTSAQPSQWALAGDSLLRMGSQIGKDLLQPIAHPLDTMIAMGRAPVDILQAQGAEFDKAKEAYDKGDKGKAALHALAYLAPVIGPMMDSMATRTSEGQGPEVAGDITAMFAGPKILEGVAKGMPSKILPAMRSMPAQEGQALDWAQQQGIPLSAGTATGNPLIKGIEQAAGNTSLMGGKIARDAKTATNEAFATIGDRLASQSNAGLPQTLETAGVDAAQKAAQKVSELGQEANAHYDVLRGMEQQDPAGMAVDIKSAQTQLKPLYDQMASSAQVVAPQGAQAKALAALHKLMTAPNTTGLSTADEALSDLKSALRSAGDSEPWSRGTGVLRQTVKSLDQQVTDAAMRGGGQDAVDALAAGRQATIGKYAAADALDLLQGADGNRSSSIVQRLMAPKDANMQQLRQVAKQVPEALPQIGRAYLEDLMTRATADPGVFKDLSSEWQKLGMATKRTVFADALSNDPNYLQSLDNFFLAAKRAGTNVNTSGTAAQTVNAAKGAALAVGVLRPEAWVLAGLQELGATATAKALNSPSVVRALTRGMNLPAMAPAAVKAGAAASINTALKAQGLPVVSFASTSEKDKE